MHGVIDKAFQQFLIYDLFARSRILSLEFQEFYKSNPGNSYLKL